MDTSAPDWHLFRAFLAVVREGSLSGAARALGTTQPTMGRQVVALEAALGITLFTRSADGLLPTEAGLRLIPSAESMAAAVEAARRSASGQVHEERGVVRITASEVVGVEILPSILADFQVLHPLIAVELALSNRNEDLLRRDADVAVRMIRPIQEGLVARQVGLIDVGLHAHRRYLERHAAPSTFEDLRGHKLIGYDRDPAAAWMIGKMGGAITKDMFAFRSDSDLAQLAAVRAGLGIGACQLGIAGRDDLVPVLRGDLIVQMEVWLAMHSDLRGDRRIRLLFDHLALEMARYATGSRRAGREAAERR